MPSKHRSHEHSGYPDGDDLELVRTFEADAYDVLERNVLRAIVAEAAKRGDDGRLFAFHDL